MTAISKATLSREKKWEERHSDIIFERIPTVVGWAIVEGVIEGAGVHLIAFFPGGKKAKARADRMIKPMPKDDEIGPLVQPAILVGTVEATSDDGLFVANHGDDDESIQALADAFLFDKEGWTK